MYARVVKPLAGLLLSRSTVTYSM